MVVEAVKVSDVLTTLSKSIFALFSASPFFSLHFFSSHKGQFKKKTCGNADRELLKVQHGEYLQA